MSRDSPPAGLTDELNFVCVRCGTAYPPKSRFVTDMPAITPNLY